MYYVWQRAEMCGKPNFFLSHMFVSTLYFVWIITTYLPHYVGFVLEVSNWVASYKLCYLCCSSILFDASHICCSVYSLNFVLHRFSINWIWKSSFNVHCIIWFILLILSLPFSFRKLEWVCLQFIFVICMLFWEVIPLPFLHSCVLSNHIFLDSRLSKFNP